MQNHKTVGAVVIVSVYQSNSALMQRGEINNGLYRQ